MKISMNLFFISVVVCSVAVGLTTYFVTRIPKTIIEHPVVIAVPQTLESKLEVVRNCLGSLEGFLESKYAQCKTLNGTESKVIIDKYWNKAFLDGGLANRRLRLVAQCRAMRSHGQLSISPTVEWLPLFLNEKVLNACFNEKDPDGIECLAYFMTCQGGEREYNLLLEKMASVQDRRIKEILSYYAYFFNCRIHHLPNLSSKEEVPLEY